MGGDGLRENVMNDRALHGEVHRVLVANKQRCLTLGQKIPAVKTDSRSYECSRRKTVM